MWDANIQWWDNYNNPLLINLTCVLRLRPSPYKETTFVHEMWCFNQMHSNLFNIFAE